MRNAANLEMQAVMDNSSGKRRRFRRAPALVALVAILAATPCWAQAQSRSEELNGGDKALRGIANIMTGVMVLPGEIRKSWNEGGPGMGLTVGLAQGLGMIVVRELVGVFELLSSPWPWPREHYDPIIDPVYPWHYFKD